MIETVYLLRLLINSLL